MGLIQFDQICIQICICLALLCCLSPLSSRTTPVQTSPCFHSQSETNRCLARCLASEIISLLRFLHLFTLYYLRVWVCFWFFSSCVVKRKTSAFLCEFLFFKLQILLNNRAVNNGPSELQEAIQDGLGKEQQMYSSHHNHMEDAPRFYDKSSAAVQLQEKCLVEEQK